MSFKKSSHATGIVGACFKVRLVLIISAVRDIEKENAPS